MQQEDLFRLVLCLGFAGVFPIALYYRLRSRVSGEKLNRREEGMFILLTLRPIALVRMGGLVTYIVSPAWMAWSSVPLPSWIRWSGVGIGGVAGVSLILVMRTLGPNLTDTVVTRAKHTLVTHGPYRWVRHPFYGACALAVTADSLVTANWFLAVTSALGMALIVIRTRKEEENLLARFGDDYAAYMRRTGRFFPRLRGAGDASEPR